MLRALADYVHIRRDPVRFARKLGVGVGENCRLIEVSRETFGSEPWLISLGDHVTVTNGVRFITHDGGVWVFRDTYPDLDVFGPIRVGSNVFLGVNTLILPGVHVGDGSVIGAGSVVTNDISPASVAAGVPARPIKDISVYERRALERGVHIRSWSIDKKRQFLVDCWSDTDKRP
jgi:acetyltransferase-like isoleucine patch superfamily enzyme